MSRRKYNTRLDADGSSSTRDLRTKVGTEVSEGAFNERAETRAGLRDLDTMIQGSSGFTQSHKDSQRSYPRETNADLRPRMHRELPHPDEVRAPISARQRRERSKAKNAVYEKTPRTERRAVAEMLGDDSPGGLDRWADVNDSLSAAAGDLHDEDISDGTRRTCQRIDRTIQRYERMNERSHVVYANLSLPDMETAGLHATAKKKLAVGEVLEFDRYTAAAHSMHEIQPETRADAERQVVLEISTRRGMYLGRSTGSDDTSHLLPRATRYEIVGVHKAVCVAPSGELTERTVVQIRDLPETEEEKS